MKLIRCTRLGPHEIVDLLGAGGPASARADFDELRRGLAVAEAAR